MHLKIRSKKLFELDDFGFYLQCSSLLCFTSPRAFNARVRTSNNNNNNDNNNNNVKEIIAEVGVIFEDVPNQDIGVISFARAMLLSIKFYSDMGLGLHGPLCTLACIVC